MSDQPDMEILADRVDRIACGKCGKILDVSELPSFSSIHCPHCGTEQKVPAVLGSFLLAEQMGAGGMGAVYRAVDQALGRFVAIKVMKQQLGADTELVESFLREARAAAALNHPNIVQIYSCGQEKGQPYIVMELVAGGRLDQMMEGGKKVDEVRLLQVALDVAEGLKAANGANLVHGDIKPANILFDAGGTAKVVDFGLAQFVNRQQEQGGIWGTPYYISPERARGGKADHRSDIYSLGATMYHALTGLPPFDGKTATDVVVARLKAPPVKIRDLAPELQPETAAVIERMMAADPVLRYPTSASLLADLKAALLAAKTAHGPSSHRKKKKKETGHLIVGGVAVVIMIVLGILVIRWFRNAPPPLKPTTPVRVAATNPAVAQKEGDPEGITLQQSEDGKQKLAVLFFTDEAEKALVQVLRGLTNGTPQAGYEALEAFSTNVPKNSARMMWVRVLQAVPGWQGGLEGKVDQALRAVVTQPVQQRRGHPVYMPQVMATYLIGDLNDQRFEKERADWPAWYGDLGTGLSGFKALKAGDLAGAATAFEAYLASERNEPAWVYALRPATRQALEQVKGWEKERDRLLALVGTGELDAARAGLDQAAGSSPLLAKPAWDAVREQIRQVEARRADELKAQAEVQRRVLVQQELDRIDAFLGTNTQFTGASKEYRKLTPLLIKLQNELEQPEAREQVAIVREQVDRMDGLKGMLIKEMSGRPFREADRELGGEAVGANVLGIRVSLAGRGTLLRNWDQISPRLMLRLCKYYAEQTGKTDAEVADIYLSMAVYCMFNGGPEVAVGLAKQARERDPAIATKIQRLLPDLPAGE